MDNLDQTHHGSGDNIAGDKIVNITINGQRREMPQIPGLRWGAEHNDKIRISAYLKAIAESLDKVKSKLEQKQVPIEDGNHLEWLFKHAHKFALPFKKDDPDLAQVFDRQLPDIVSQLQIADYFMDGQPRFNASLSEDEKNVIMTMTPESQINKAIEALTRAKGIISAHSKKFEIEGY